MRDSFKTVNIRTDLYDRAKAVAASQDRTLANYVGRAVEAALKAEQSK